MVYNIFDKMSSLGNVFGIKQNEQVEELYKPTIKKIRKRKVYSSFKDNIWGVDLADAQLINKCNKRIGFLFCVIDLFSK